MAIHLKRAYEDPAPGDGYRILVDRLWPRGVRKEEADIDLWLKDIAPSSELRKWFRHEPEKWDEFRRRYFQELDRKPEVVEQLAEKARDGTVTLVYAAKDEAHNDAVALKEYVQKKGIR